MLGRELQELIREGKLRWTLRLLSADAEGAPLRHLFPGHLARSKEEHEIFLERGEHEKVRVHVIEKPAPQVAAYQHIKMPAPALALPVRVVGHHHDELAGQELFVGALACVPC